MLDQALTLAASGRKQAEEELFHLMRMPTVSSLTPHRADCRAAASWLAERLQGLGMATELIDQLPDGCPIVLAEWMGRPGAPVLTIYGHYDVQPPDPLAQWRTPPFEPTVIDGFVYGRGASDDKGQLMASVIAAGHAFAAGGPPINLRFLIEGEEEITGFSICDFVPKNLDRLKTDYLFIADGGFASPTLPVITTALRGLVYAEIEVIGAAADLHSGIFGGVAPNPLQSLAHILAAIKDREGRITIPGFYADVRTPAPSELEGWRRQPLTEAELLANVGSKALEGEPGFDHFQRRWARPTFEIHGIVGGFVDEGQKTVIPARAKAKVSTRLVPDQDPAKVFEALRDYAVSLATPGVEVQVTLLSEGRPILIEVDHPGVTTAIAAFESAFGMTPALVREAASIPVTAELQALNSNMVVSGFGLPDDGLHSPNERFSLDHFHRGTEMVLHMMWNLAGAG
ncbi:MAG TPA: M20/M25/M40 family metallo-hydrolase [Candidatus Dormibacteraeota bacterium]|jgi:acetylornithine deacetylase/succinyl-diaminopimelate desuccinylase-like protein|nr:M20/M25/M40 family metallo-hydrolase [Candidatus Dormibacteraeota bacterium]